MNTMLQLKIPASTANLGVGFDSIGMALDRFLEIEAYVNHQSNWTFEHVGGCLEGLPEDDTHFVYVIAQQIAQIYHVTLPALHIKMRSDIPLARGLGSSASALVGAIYIADHFGDLGLSTYEILQHACRIEGHPDNVAPTIYGGLTVGYYNPDTEVTDVVNLPHPDADIIISIPNYELKTSDSRNVLPDILTHQESVRSSAVSNTMIAALMRQDYLLAGKMMMLDGFHEPYRQHLIAEFEQIKEMSLANHAYATVISGAGPTVLTMVNKRYSGPLLRQLKHAIPTCDSVLVTMNHSGVEVNVSHLYD